MWKMLIREKDTTIAYLMEEVKSLYKNTVICIKYMNGHIIRTNYNKAGPETRMRVITSGTHTAVRKTLTQ
jgi:hypothetical protein